MCSLKLKSLRRFLLVRCGGFLCLVAEGELRQVDFPADDFLPAFFVGHVAERPRDGKAASLMAVRMNRFSVLAKSRNVQELCLSFARHAVDVVLGYVEVGDEFTVLGGADDGVFCKVACECECVHGGFSFQCEE